VPFWQQWSEEKPLPSPLVMRAPHCTRFGTRMQPLFQKDEKVRSASRCLRSYSWVFKPACQVKMLAVKPRRVILSRYS
jgi:hypothetical protein